MADKLLDKHFDRDMWRVLCKIRELLRYVRGNTITSEQYHRVIPPNQTRGTSSEAERLILNNLQEIGAIKIKPYEPTMDDYRHLKLTGSNSAIMSKPFPSFVSLEVIAKRFNKLYREYEKRKDLLGTAESQSANSTPGQAKEDPFLFYLSRQKGLYRMSRGEIDTYPIHRAPQRFQILSGLTKSFRNTNEFAKEIKTTSGKLRAQIAGIKKLIAKRFIGVKGEDFIEADQNFGYRIGEKITLKRTE